MSSTPDLVSYLGQMIPKENFRTYIYAKDGSTKLVESYDEFDLCVNSTEWFSTREEAEQEQKKPRKKSEV